MRQRQRGLSFLGFIIVAAVAGFFLFIGATLFPIYSEYASVRAAMKAIQNEPGSATMSVLAIQQALEKRFNIAYVSSVKKENIFIMNRNGRKLRIAYEVRKPMVYNIDVVAKFDYTVDLTRQSVDP